MDHAVRGIRQMKRGLEAEVTLKLADGTTFIPTMMVTLGPLDPEWKAIQHLLHDLFVRRATDHIRSVMEYEAEREGRRAKEGRKETRKSA